MPVRSLNSRIVKWPDRQEVEVAIRSNAAAIVRAEPRLRALGYFGTYARNEWGVGSDVDLVAVLDVPSEEPTPGALELDWTRDLHLPVPHDLFTYSVTDLRRMAEDEMRFAGMLASETVWVYGRWPAGSELDAA